MPILTSKGKIAQWIVVIGLVMFFYFAIRQRLDHHTEEIPCEIKRFVWKKDTDNTIEYVLESKMVRQFQRSRCHTDNELNKEYIFSRGPVIIIYPFRPEVVLPKTTKDIYLEE